MSKIRGYNNNLERKLRKEMRSRGIYGYRIDDKSVLGTPDICYKGLKSLYLSMEISGTDLIGTKGNAS